MPDDPHTPTPSADSLADAPQPTRHTHSPKLLEACDVLGIPRESAEVMDPAALRQEIADAQLLQSVRQTREGSRQSAVSPAPSPKPAEADEDFAIPPEVAAELEDRPHTKKLLQTVGKEAVRSKKLERELEAVRSQTANSSLEAQVQTVLAGIPTPTRISRAVRDRAVYAELGYLHAAGQLQGLSVDQCVRRAHENLYGSSGGSAGAGGSAGSGANPAPTPSAKPTDRLGKTKGLSRRDEIIEQYKEALAKDADKQALDTAFVP